MILQDLKNELLQYARPQDIEEKFKCFHKTTPGGYAEHDSFLGITVPNIRKVTKKYYNKINLVDVEKLLHSKYHEYRLTAVLILTLKMKEEKQKDIVDMYLNNTQYINGWDLVDLSAHYVLGAYLLNNMDKVDILYNLANSNNLWKQRISIVSTWIFIRNGVYEYTLNIAEMLLYSKEDLIHKAVGWMLREIGKKDFNIEYNFLKKYYKQMPRTMLRYAIEKFDEELRQKFLKGEL